MPASPLAALLARGDLEVLLLEREPRFRDRVRGEFLAPWGVAEAMDAGLLEPLAATPGASVLSRYVPQRRDLPSGGAGALCGGPRRRPPECSGALAPGHPEACEALARTALAAGATVLRGRSALRVADVRRRVLHVGREGRERVVGPRLVCSARSESAGG